MKRKRRRREERKKERSSSKVKKVWNHDYEYESLVLYGLIESN